MRDPRPSPQLLFFFLVCSSFSFCSSSSFLSSLLFCPSVPVAGVSYKLLVYMFLEKRITFWTLKSGEHFQNVLQVVIQYVKPPEKKGIAVQLDH